MSSMGRHSLPKTSEWLQLRCVEDGTVIGLQQFMFTIGLCYDVKHDPMELPYKYRFCYSYENIADAIRAYKTWNGKGLPEGHWIKQKGARVDIRNPRLPMDKYEIDGYKPNYEGECDACGMDHTVMAYKGEHIVHDFGLCGVCTFGTTKALDPDMWDKLDD